MNRKSQMMGSLVLALALAGGVQGQSTQPDNSGGGGANGQNALPQTTVTPPAPPTSSANVNNSANVSGHEYAASPAPSDQEQARNAPSGDQGATNPKDSAR